MQIILYLSVALIAIAFFILVLSLVKTLGAMKETLESVSKTLDGLESQLQGVTGETTMLLHKTNALAEDINGKVERLDTVVNAVQEVGTTVQDLNASLRKMTTSVTSAMVKNQDKIAQIVQWGTVAKELRDKWFGDKSTARGKRKSSQTDVTPQTHRLESGSS